VDDLSNRMREVATIIQDEGYVTLGNSCIDAADELDRLRGDMADYEKSYEFQVEVNHGLRRELEEAQRDAARYRWLRERAYKDDGSIYCAGPDGSYDDFAVGYLPDGLDAAIDAAMAEPKEVPRG